MEARLASVTREHAAAIDALPRGGAAVVARGGDETVVVAQLDREAPEEARWSLRVRRDRLVSDTEVRGIAGVVDESGRRVTFRVPTAARTRA